MHSFLYNADEDQQENFQRLAASFDAVIIGNQFVITAPFGEGFISELAISTELAVMRLEYMLYEPSYCGAQKSGNTIYTLNVLTSRMPADAVASIQLGSTSVSFGSGSHQQVYLMSSGVDMLGFQPPGFRLSALKLRVLPEWLMKHSGITDASAFFDRYISLDSHLFSAIVLSADMVQHCENLKAMMDSGDHDAVAIEAACASLVRYCVSEIHATIRAFNATGFSQQEALDVMDYVRRSSEASFLKPAPKADLAATMGMTPFRFGRLFTEIYGRSYATWLMETRMEWAMARLDDGIPVASVADLLGYENYSRFSDAFRKHTGMLPSEIAKRKS